MIAWKDRTGGGWSDKTVIGAEVKVGQFRLSVHKHINYRSDVWLSSCSYLYNCHELASKDIAGAKRQAAAYLLTYLQNGMDDILKIVE